MSQQNILKDTLRPDFYTGLTIKPGTKQDGKTTYIGSVIQHVQVTSSKHQYGGPICLAVTPVKHVPMKLTNYQSYCTRKQKRNNIFSAAIRAKNYSNKLGWSRLGYETLRHIQY